MTIPALAPDDFAQHPLRIGISTRALFNLEQEHQVFRRQGVEAYSKMQLDREKKIIAKGAGFHVIERLLRLNVPNQQPYVEVVLLSRNSPDLSLRAFNSIQQYGLNINVGSFTSGRPIGPYVKAWGLDLFLSNEQTDVTSAARGHCASAKLGSFSQCLSSGDVLKDDYPDEVRISFDGDAVIFSKESDNIFKNKGLEAFIKHETEQANNPMNAGPFGKFLKKLSYLRSVYMDHENDASRVRISIVTARNAPAHERVIHTLRAWGTPADETHFVGANEKAAILQASGVHIFFDDQEKHVRAAASKVASGHVPGPHAPDSPVIPASPAIARS